MFRLRRAFMVVLALVATTLSVVAGPASADGGHPGLYHIRNLNSNRCLLDQSKPGAMAVTYDCLGYAFTDQIWVFQPWISDLYATEYWIKNTNSDECLVDQGLNPSTQAFTTACGQFADQLWYVINTDHGYLIENVNGHRNANTYRWLVSQDRGNDSPVFQYVWGDADSYWSLDQL